MLASVFKEKEVLYENLKVSLNPRAGPDTTFGFLYLPSRAELSVGEYTLKLEDGRTIAATVMSVRGGIALFRGADN